MQAMVDLADRHLAELHRQRSELDTAISELQALARNGRQGDLTVFPSVSRGSDCCA